MMEFERIVLLSPLDHRIFIMDMRDVSVCVWMKSMTKGRVSVCVRICNYWSLCCDNIFLTIDWFAIVHGCITTTCICTCVCVSVLMDILLWFIIISSINTSILTNVNNFVVIIHWFLLSGFRWDNVWSKCPAIRAFFDYFNQ